MWGVNGHPYQQEGYRAVPIAQQLDLVRELGATYYRCDWQDWPDFAATDDLVRQARARG